MPLPPLTIVPLQTPGLGKTRLAGALEPQDRARLVGAMLRDVVTALRGAGIERLVVAAGGSAAAAAGTALGAEVILDPPGACDLDAAIAAAVTTAQRATDPPQDVLVVTADLPLLRSADVTELLAVDAEVVIAPTAGGGTGALLRRAGVHLATAYGTGSASRHLAAARLAGHVAASRAIHGFTHDVDTWADLVALHEEEIGPATAAVLPAVLRARAG
ncbi:MAG: 2-phospho-L-lactate guanylyltransferase [Nitriliruptoraceae bacterium]|nr:2-phospho-L-lactate guanylyltransferase [Nitriliruptoraceae bacterium]